MAMNKEQLKAYKIRWNALHRKPPAHTAWRKIVKQYLGKIR
jgi:hypothetical protein